MNAIVEWPVSLAVLPPLLWGVGGLVAVRLLARMPRRPEDDAQRGRAAEPDEFRPAA